MTISDVLIVGAGHGGAQAAIALRKRGFTGSITLAGAEPDPPYERPPLSKDYLAGTRSFERLLIRPIEFWKDRDIALRLGAAVVEVDPEARCCRLTDGRELAYRRMIWATGGRARRLPCADDHPGIYTIRDRSGVDALVRALPTADRIAIIGGGYIGLEAAAVLTRLGKSVTLLEAADRLLSRVAGEAVARFFDAEHRANGIVVKTRVEVRSVDAGAGGGIILKLGDNSSIGTDLVIVGIGIDAAADPLLVAGAAGTNGVDVDEQCRTSLPQIWAIGDCAAHRNAFADGRWIRLESVQNAHDQAAVAAASICGEPCANSAVPWFWSNQYDLRLQTVGLCQGHDDFVVRGNPADRTFSVVYLRQGRVIALDCINAVRDYVQGRRLVEQRLSPSTEDLADVRTPLKAL